MLIQGLFAPAPNEIKQIFTQTVRINGFRKHRPSVSIPMSSAQAPVRHTQNQYSHDELLACGHGELFGPGNARLPLPPMLMFDRITRISDSGGQYDKGEIIAELDINPDLWFFHCHFEKDPVMPGCLGLDALCQLSGIHLGWLGGPGRGRALGADEVKYSGQVTPKNRLVTYRINIRRLIQRKLYMGIADGVMEVDGKEIYHARNLRVGLFTSTDDF